METEMEQDHDYEHYDDVEEIQEFALQFQEQQPSSDDESSSDDGSTGTDINDSMTNHLEDEDETRSSAYSNPYDETLAHYEQNMARCTCCTSCNIEGAFAMEMEFRRMKETERVAFVRAMLFTLTAPPDTENQLSSWLPSTAQARKKHHRNTDYDISNATTVYYLKGKRVYRYEFSAVVQLNANVINRHASEVTNQSPKPYRTNAGKNRKGEFSVQTITAISF